MGVGMSSNAIFISKADSTASLKCMTGKAKSYATEPSVDALIVRWIERCSARREAHCPSFRCVSHNEPFRHKPPDFTYRLGDTNIDVVGYNFIVQKIAVDSKKPVGNVCAMKKPKSGRSWCSIVNACRSSGLVLTHIAQKGVEMNLARLLCHGKLLAIMRWYEEL